jgi:hypothetical protein
MEIDGTLVEHAISKDFLIVSCSDCTAPFVNFYDRNTLEIVKAYKYSGPYGNARINLAIWENTYDTLNVLVGASDSIDQIEYYKNDEGRAYFNFLDNVFALNLTQEVPSKSPEIRVAVSADYVTFKTSWEDAIYIMANCQYDEEFDPRTFTCSPCLHAGKTYGI